MTISKLLQAKRALENHLEGKPDIKLQYKVIRFIKGCETAQTFYGKKMSEIINECGEHDENGNVVSSGEGVRLDKTKIKEFGDATAALDKLDAEDVPAIRFSMLECAALELTTGELMRLDDFIDWNAAETVGDTNGTCAGNKKKIVKK